MVVVVEPVTQRKRIIHNSQPASLHLATFCSNQLSRLLWLFSLCLITICAAQDKTLAEIGVTHTDCARMEGRILYVCVRARVCVHICCQQQQHKVV